MRLNPFGDLLSLLLYARSALFYFYAIYLNASLYVIPIYFLFTLLDIAYGVISYSVWIVELPPWFRDLSLKATLDAFSLELGTYE